MVKINTQKLLSQVELLIENGSFSKSLQGEISILYKQLQDPKQDILDLLHKFAIAYRKARLFSEAAELCKQALLLQPENAFSHHILGSVQQCLNNFPEAIDCYNTAKQLDPSLAETHYFLGNVLQIIGNNREAADSYYRAIKLQPGYLEALSNLGAVLMALHRFGEARNVLEKANQLYPDCSQVLCNLGDLALRDDNYEKASFFAESVLNTNPNFVDAHHLLGRISRQQGDYEQTLKHFYRALEIQPNNENITGSIAEILEKRGEFTKAQQLLQPLIQRETHNPFVLRAYSAVTRSLKNENKAIRLLENSIAIGGLDPHQQANLHSELGKQYDHQKNYSRAFEHYRQANLLERELKTHGRMTTGKTFTGSMDISEWRVKFDADFWKNLPHSETTSKRPVFIVGMPRSGTTLTEQILASHPDVYGAGELPDIPDIAATLGERGTGSGRIEYLSRINSKILTEAAKKYLDTLHSKSSDALHVVDKMPTNFGYLGLISLLFPHAPIIHLKRDPRDICLSMYFQRFGGSMVFTTDLQELAAYYSMYSSIMDYWKTVLDINILEIQYEELVDNQELTIHKIVEYCGLEWNDQCLYFHETSRDVHTPSYDQVRQPMYRKSVGRWKNYEQHLAPLLEALEPFL